MSSIKSFRMGISVLPESVHVAQKSEVGLGRMVGIVVLLSHPSVQLADWLGGRTGGQTMWITTPVARAKMATRRVSPLRSTSCVMERRPGGGVDDSSSSALLLSNRPCSSVLTAA